MITTSGRDTIVRFFGGDIAQIGDTLAFGVGTAPATAADTKLDYEVFRTSVAAVNGDLANGRTVFKGRIAPGTIKRIYEIGLYETSVVTQQSGLLNLFGASVNTWSNGELDPTFARAGVNALRVDVNSSATIGAEITGMNNDFSEFTDSDQVVAGVYVTAAISSLRLRFGTDSDNYFEFLFDDLEIGYNVVKAGRGTATVVGTPTWASIQYVAVRPSATADNNTTIHLDGLRLEQQAPGQLVARTVLDEPIEVDTDIPSDVEYALRVAFA